MMIYKDRSGDEWDTINGRLYLVKTNGVPVTPTMGCRPEMVSKLYGPLVGMDGKAMQFKSNDKGNEMMEKETTEYWVNDTHFRQTMAQVDELIVNPEYLHAGDEIRVTLKGRVLNGAHIQGEEVESEAGDFYKPEYEGVVIEDEEGYVHEVYMASNDGNTAPNLEVVRTRRHQVYKLGQMYRSEGTLFVVIRKDGSLKVSPVDESVESYYYSQESFTRRHPYAQLVFSPVP